MAQIEIDSEIWEEITEKTDLLSDRQLMNLKVFIDEVLSERAAKRKPQGA